MTREAQAADLHQSLTDVSVDDIDVREALQGDTKGATGRNDEGGRRKLPATAAAAAAVAAATAAASPAAVAALAAADADDAEARDRPRSRSGRSEGGRGREDVGGPMSLSGVEGGGGGGGLVTRAIARRPLREMLR